MYHMEPIGILRTAFQEKFGVPRQSLMVGEAKGILKLNSDPRYREAFRHLEGFSHIWIVFVFHEHVSQEWRSTITPPRLDSPGKIGVFASRSPHRPNPIGLSAVKLEKIDLDGAEGVELHVSGVDILDGTPVLDIQPYLPYVDCVLDATPGWTESEIPRFSVTFSTLALQQIEASAGEYKSFHRGDFKRMLEQMLELDPRPTSQRKTMAINDPANEGMEFAFRLLNIDIRWVIKNSGIYVIELKPE